MVSITERIRIRIRIYLEKILQIEKQKLSQQPNQNKSVTFDMPASTQSLCNAELNFSFTQ